MTQAPWLSRSQLFVVAALALVIVLTTVLPFVLGATFGQRCERLHPGADAAVIEQCVSDFKDPKRAAYREGVKAGVEATMAEVKKQLENYTLTPVHPAPAE